MAKKNNKRNNKRNKNTKEVVAWPKGLVIIPRNVHGIANAIRVKLMYTESGITAAASGYITYRANDLFDPQAVTSGLTMSGNQQPQFSDAWKSMYNKYRVLSGTISVRLSNANNNTIPIFIEVSPEDQLVSTTNAVQASVARFATSRIFPNGPSTPPMTLTRRMSTAEINGISTNSVLIQSEYQAPFTGTPVDPWYWQVRFSAVDFSTTPLIYVFVHITFDAILTDPVQDDDND